MTAPPSPRRDPKPFATAEAAAARDKANGTDEGSFFTV
jgi:hypothetical protein